MVFIFSAASTSRCVQCSVKIIREIFILHCGFCGFFNRSPSNMISWLGNENLFKSLQRTDSTNINCLEFIVSNELESRHHQKASNLINFIRKQFTSSSFESLSINENKNSHCFYFISFLPTLNKFINQTNKENSFNIFFLWNRKISTVNTFDTQLKSHSTIWSSPSLVMALASIIVNGCGTCVLSFSIWSINKASFLIWR